MDPDIAQPIQPITPETKVPQPIAQPAYQQPRTPSCPVLWTDQEDPYTCQYACPNKLID